KQMKKYIMRYFEKKLLEIPIIKHKLIDRPMTDYKNEILKHVSDKKGEISLNMEDMTSERFIGILEENSNKIRKKVNNGDFTGTIYYNYFNDENILSNISTIYSLT